ncbi:MAG: phosphate ABC transporter permease subunit PstC [Anaeroplasma sp.]|uniref:phosphate ABC transporter permease subunit PstC n=1 Tax=Anaeroplasma sp. TaxID=1872523 RepID=UPI002A918919|nr:phosphate ABC transporter permease subunit PstC [Anaeroplasma sp.]MDY5983397.1 phosphate ABC transporter permease subunit PstC [Anaeroplasma sp.]
MKENILKKSSLKRKTRTDIFFKGFFMSVCILCSAIIVVIIAFIVIKGVQPFFKEYIVNNQIYRISFSEFLFGYRWNFAPNHFGAGFIILNTIYITVLALFIAVPISILSSLFIVRIAPKKIGTCLQLVIELLASVPSIIYGLFGQAYLTRIVMKISEIFNIQTLGGQSVFTASLVLGMMIFPTITMVSITSIQAVNNNLILGSLALGASKTQTNFKVVLKGAKNGIFSGIILGVGRALGEATAVSKVCGNAQVGPTFSLFDTTSTITTTILSGFNEASGMAYDIKFSLGIVLIIIIVSTNIVLNLVKKKVGN